MDKNTGYLTSGQAYSWLGRKLFCLGLQINIQFHHTARRRTRSSNKDSVFKDLLRVLGGLRKY
jgi:hypothetical protein